MLNRTLVISLVVLVTACLSGPSGISRSGYLRADDGALLYYRVVGDGPRTVVVPLVFWNQARFKKEVPPGLRVVFYDPRGRQKSDAWNSSTATLDQALRDLDAVRRVLGEDRISLIGTSFYGAMVARYAMLSPEHVDRIVMVGAMGPRFGMNADPGPMQERLDRPALERNETLRHTKKITEVEYCREFWRIYAPVYVGRPENAALLDVNCDDFNELPVMLFPGLAALVASMGQWDWTADAAKVTAPVLIVHGTNDLVVPISVAHEWARILPENELLVIDRGGHVPWYDDADLLFPQVMTFLTD